MSTSPTIDNRDLLATCWTWAGDAAPARGDERSPEDIHARIAAAAAAGWNGVGLIHADVVALRDSMGLPALRKLLDEAGIEKVELEFISNWWTSGAEREASDQVRADLFDAAPLLGVRTIKVGAQLTAFGSTEPVDGDLFAESFDALASEAGRHGLRVAVEPMPMSNLKTVVDGVELVTAVDNPHGGLVVDTWHVRRGGTPNEALPDVLPIERVFVAELDDADEAIVGSLWDDTINHRRNPGEGALDTAGFIVAMHRAGWAGHWGVEIISHEQRAKPITRALADTAAATRAAFDAAERRLSQA